MIFGKRTLLALLATLICLSTLAACATTTDTAEIENEARRLACEGFRPIGWETADSDLTIKEIKAHNAAYAAMCAEDSR